MDIQWFQAPEYWLARFLFERALAAIYLIAFLGTAEQFPALAGEHGLLPAPRFLAAVPFRAAPSLFHWRYSDRLLRRVCWLGMAVSLALLAGIPQAGPVWAPMLAWFVLWALYLSIVNIGQTFYGFAWETLLLEAGFLAIFLGPDGAAAPGHPAHPLAAVPAGRSTSSRRNRASRSGGRRRWRPTTCAWTG